MQSIMADVVVEETATDKETTATATTGSTSAVVRDSTALSDEEDQRRHAKIDDPILAPVKKKDKKTPPVNDGDETTEGGKGGGNILSRLFDPDRVQKPALWKHIKLVAPGPTDQPPTGSVKWRSKDAVAAYCLKCRRLFTYSKGTSKTISRHMMAFHGLVTTDGEFMDENGHAPLPPLKKAKLESTKKRQPSNAILSARTRALLRWLIASRQPLALVYHRHHRATPDADFAAFCRTLNSTYNPPPLHTLERYAQERYETLRAHLRQFIATRQCDRLSLWARPVRVVASAAHERKKPEDGITSHPLGPEMRTFYPIQLTFVTPSYVRESRTAAVIMGKMGEENEPVSALFGAIDTALDQLSIDKKKVLNVCISSLDGSLQELEGKMKNSSLSSVEYCKPKLCVLDVLDKLTMEWIKRDLGKTYKIVKEAMNDETVAMNTKAYAAQAAYTLFQSSRSMEIPSVSAMLPHVLAIMSPIMDGMEMMTTDNYPTIGLTITVLRRIRKVFDDMIIDEFPGYQIEGDVGLDNKCDVVHEDVDESAKRFFKSIKSSFAEAFEDMLSSNVAALWTIPLDPRLVMMSELSDEEQLHVKEALVSSVWNLTSSSVKQNATSANDDHKSTMKGIFWNGDSENAQLDDRQEYAKQSVELYFETVRSEPCTDDPLGWWKKNRGTFPELATLARKWMATSMVCVRPAVAGEMEDKVIWNGHFDENEIIRTLYLHDNIRQL